MDYKRRCAEVILTRGKRVGTYIPAKGKTVEEVLQILLDLRKEKPQER